MKQRITAAELKAMTMKELAAWVEFNACAINRTMVMSWGHEELFKGYHIRPEYTGYIAGRLMVKAFHFTSRTRKAEAQSFAEWLHWAIFGEYPAEDTEETEEAETTTEAAETEAETETIEETAEEAKEVRTMWKFKHTMLTSEVMDAAEEMFKDIDITAEQKYNIELAAYVACMNETTTAARLADFVRVLGIHHVTPEEITAEEQTTETEEEEEKETMFNNYTEAVTEDAVEYIRDNYTAEEIAEALTDRDEFAEKLNDEMWVADEVTGNGSGSYTFDRMKAREFVLSDIDTVREALREFCTEADTIAKKFLDEDWEYFDVTARCYVLGQAIDAALDIIEAETKAA